MGGMGRRGGGGERGRGAEMVLPESGDFKKLSPAGLMIDNRKKLSLADSQVSTLTVMRDRARDGNAPILSHYDSVRKEVREVLNNRRNRRQQQEADSTQGEGMQALRTMRFLLDTLSTRREQDVREVLEYFKDEKQHKEAARLLNDQDLTFQERLPRLGAGGRGRRGGGPEGPPR
jgi:hypothetical protein